MPKLSMRTTVTIDDTLRQHLRSLHEARDAHNQNLPELPTFPGTSRPGISIDDNAAVRDVLDEGHTLAGR